MNEKNSLYEIYRACRLCGAGSGYKMPIVQSVLGLEDGEIELSHKIMECLQIEVNFKDRMPPLICESCADKVNDFFEFRNMCHETNNKTRMRLGLPLQAAPDAAERNSEGSETVNLDSDSDEGEPLAKHSTPHVKSKPKPKSKKELDVHIRMEKYQPALKEKPRSPSPELTVRRELRRRDPQSPKRLTRQNSDISLSELLGLEISQKSKSAPKSVLNRERERQRETKIDMMDEIEDQPLLVVRTRKKREVPVEIPPAKKHKATVEPTRADNTPKPGPKSSKDEFKPPPPLKEDKPKAGPRSRKPDPTPAPPAKTRDTPPSASRSKKPEASPPRVARASPQPQKSYICPICRNSMKAPQGLASHLKIHTPTFTSMTLACNACEAWFPCGEEAAAHHRLHADHALPYTCNKCYDDFCTARDYQLHFEREQCLPTYEVADAQCEECGRAFPTYKLLEEHACAGRPRRPAGNCRKCSRSYTLMRYLVAHEMKCNYGKKAEPVVDPEVSSRLLPMQVRIAKCDSLLEAGGDRCNVAGVSHRFGLDSNSSYPYLYSMGEIRIKNELAVGELGHMVDIQDEIKTENLNDKNYIHWDSDVNEENENDAPGVYSPKNTVDSLATISLKTLFSQKCLGKVPRKKRKFKLENEFDSILSIGFHGFDIKRNIDNIIDNLGNELLYSDNYDSDTVLDKKKGPNVNSPGVDHFDAVKDIVETSSATEVYENVDHNEDSDRTGDVQNRLSNKAEDSNDSESAVKEQNEGKDKQISDTSDATSVRSENEEDSAKSPQKSSAASGTTDHYNHAKDVSPNCNEFRDNSKNSRVGDKTFVNEKESLAIDDKVENSTLTEESETMEGVNEESNIEGNVENSIAEMGESDKINDKQTERESDEKNKEIANAGDVNSVSTEDKDTETCNIQNEKSFPFNDNNRNTEDDSNSEKDDGQSSINKTNSDEVNLKNDNTYPTHKSYSNDKISDRNETVAASSTNLTHVFKGNESHGERMEIDKFNINKLNEDDKRLIAELDAQIGEVSKNGDNIPIIGENEALIDKNEAYSEVFEGNDPPSVEICDNIGFDIASEGKDKILSDLMQKRNDDLRSLDLDSISDEEFDFDL